MVRPSPGAKCGTGFQPVTTGMMPVPRNAGEDARTTKRSSGTSASGGIASNTPMPPILAQEQDYTRPLIWSLVLIIIIIGMFAAVSFYRKWMNSSDSGSAEGFTLSDLRKLHKSGQMTDEEFEKAKKILVGNFKAASEKPANKPKDGPRTIPGGLDIDPDEK